MSFKDLKPMDLGEIFNASFRLAFSSLKNFFGIFLIYSIISFVLYVLMQLSVLWIDGFSLSSLTQNSVSKTIITYIYYIPTWLLSAYFGGLFIDFFIKLYMKDEWDYKTSTKMTLSKYGSLLGASLLTILIIVGGVFLCLIGALVFAIFLSFVTTSIIYENKTSGKSISRSFKLASYNFWQILGIYVLFFLIILGSILVIGGIVSIPAIIIYFQNKEIFTNLSDISRILSEPSLYLPIILLSLFYLILYFIYLLMVSALSYSLNVILFFNQKVKHEQFGIENMVESVTTENISEL
jgi:hypothetical protein